MILSDVSDLSLSHAVVVSPQALGGHIPKCKHRPQTRLRHSQTMSVTGTDSNTDMQPHMIEIELWDTVRLMMSRVWIPIRSIAEDRI